jgi:hypothetical protein
LLHLATNIIDEVYSITFFDAFSKDKAPKATADQGFALTELGNSSKYSDYIQFKVEKDKTFFTMILFSDTGNDVLTPPNLVDKAKESGKGNDVTIPGKFTIPLPDRLSVTITSDIDSIPEPSSLLMATSGPALLLVFARFRQWARSGR